MPSEESSSLFRPCTSGLPQPRPGSCIRCCRPPELSCSIRCSRLLSTTGLCTWGPCSASSPSTFLLQVIVLSTGSPTDWKVENSPGSISGVSRGRKHRLGPGVPHKVTGSDLGKKASLSVGHQQGCYISEGWMASQGKQKQCASYFTCF